MPANARQPRLVLTSNSPRRKRLLALGGWDFTVSTVEVDESPHPGEQPDDYVLRLAVSKAQAVASQVDPDSVIVAADTTVVDRVMTNSSEQVKLEILGKPANAEQAVQMLQRLRGHTHQVHTAIAVLHASQKLLITDLCITDVAMRSYSEDEVRAYVESGDPLDKAGAYAIQHPAFQPVESLRWCYANVVGLPLCLLTRTLERVGIPPQSEITWTYLTQKEDRCLISGRVLAEIDQA